MQIQAPFCSQPTAVDHSCEQQSLGCRWPKLLSTSQGNTAITRENPLFWSIRSKTQAVFDLCSTDTHVRHSCVGCTYTSVYTVNVHTQLAAVESFFKHSEDTQMLVFTLPWSRAAANKTSWSMNLVFLGATLLIPVRCLLLPVMFSTLLETCFNNYLSKGQIFIDLKHRSAWEVHNRIWKE